jgi:cytochrome c oxidase subunit 4
MSEQAKHEEHQHHVVSPVVYIVILFSLLVGTALTVWASFIDLGPWNPVVALFIATSKAMLVVLFFMGVKYSTKLTKLTVISGIFIFFGLISMTLADYMSRAWGRW